MQVVNALVKADKDFDLLVIPGGGHGAAGTPYGRRRQTDFFVKHLLDNSRDTGTQPRKRGPTRRGKDAQIMPPRATPPHVCRRGPERSSCC